MATFLFNQNEPVNVQACTKLLRDPFGNLQSVGSEYCQIRRLTPKELALAIDTDIFQAVKNYKLPEMQFKVAVPRVHPKPLLKVTVQSLKELILAAVFPHDQEIRSYLEDETIPDYELNELGEHVHDKIAQIVWKYNADVVRPGSHYPQTAFNYQVTFSRELLAQQIAQLGRVRNKARATGEDYAVA